MFKRQSCDEKEEGEERKREREIVIWKGCPQNEGKEDLLDERADAVPVCCDEELFALFDRWSDGGIPAWKDTYDGIFEALSTWDLIVGEAGVFGLFAGEELVIFRSWWRRNVVTTTPNQNLFLFFFGRGGG